MSKTFQYFSSLLVFFYIFISLFSKSNSFSPVQLPVIRFAINGSNLGDIVTIAIEKVLNKTHFSLPKIEIKEKIPILGNLHFLADNITLQISNLTQSIMSIQFMEEKKISFIMNLLNEKIFFNYSFNSGVVSSEGNGIIVLKKMSIALNTSLIQVKNHYEPEKYGPGLELGAMTLNDMDIKFIFSKKGTFEKFIKFFHKNFQTILMKAIENELNSKSLLNAINELLKSYYEKMRLSITVDNYVFFEDRLNLSFSLNEKPKIKDNCLEISFGAELIGDYYCYNISNNETLPHIYNNSTLFTNKTINTVISQFIFNNALDYLRFQGFFSYEITNDTIDKPRINVRLISSIIPEITSVYKPNQLVKIISMANDSPVIKFKENNLIKIDIYQKIKLFVLKKTQAKNLKKNDTGELALDGDSHVKAEADFYIQNDTIKITVNSLKMVSFEVRNSTIGKINIERIIINVNQMITPILNLKINQKIKELIESLPKPIKIEDILLKELEVNSHKNYLKIDLSPILIKI